MEGAVEHLYYITINSSRLEPKTRDDKVCAGDGDENAT